MLYHCHIVAISPGDDFGAFTPPKPMVQADQLDWDNARARVAALRANPAYYKPPVVDDEDYFAEIYNMAVLPYHGLCACSSPADLAVSDLCCHFPA